MKHSAQWSHIQENGAYVSLKIMMVIYRFAGKPILEFILFFVVGFYFIFNFRARKASRFYLQQIHCFIGSKSPWKNSPNLWHSFQHFMSFGQATIDKLVVWLGEYKKEDLIFSGYSKYISLKKQKKGIMIITSHIGNVDICRGIAGGVEGIPLTVLMYNAHAPNFQKITEEVTPTGTTIEIIEVNKLTPDIAIKLQYKILIGETIIIAGDRMPVNNLSRHETLPFLGQDAAFAQGPFILASLLDCPVLLLFSMKHNNSYHVFFEFFSNSLKTAKKDRQVILKKHIKRYVKRLEHYACAYPLQWYNFYDYWNWPK